MNVNKVPNVTIKPKKSSTRILKCSEEELSVKYRISVVFLGMLLLFSCLTINKMIISDWLLTNEGLVDVLTSNLQN